MNRRAKIMEAIEGDPIDTSPATLPTRLCDYCVGHLRMSGAALTLMSADAPRAVLARAGVDADAIEDLQFATGEGPCIDAYGTGRIVLEPDLASAGLRRWPGFAHGAVGLGTVAMFAFPLRVGAICLGALALTRRENRALSADEIADGLVVADLATHAVVVLQRGTTDGALGAQLAEAGDDRIQVHQATGMVSIQLSVDVADALARLRAFAMADDRTLYAVARDVVARKLRFEP